MNPTQLAKRQERLATERLVIQRVAEGYRVFAAEEPRNCYIVSGPSDAPECTCPDFQYHRCDPDWQCKHILEVLGDHSSVDRIGQIDESYESQERRAIQEDSRPPRRRKAVNVSNGSNRGVLQLLLRRSVSPDGRIDSLSVELSAPVDGLLASDIHARAEHMLGLQSGIVAQFLERTEHSNANDGLERGNGDRTNEPFQRTSQASSGRELAHLPARGTGTEPAVPAKLVDVAGMDGKWGRRLFLNVEVNGRTLKLFGKPEELAAHISAAGHFVPEPFGEGTVLNIPCAVTTKPSPDGRYTNIERVLPANQSASRPPSLRRVDR